MALLLLNASNRLSQGFLRVAAESGQYERILLADIYPTYSTIERLLRFKATLNTKTELTLVKLGDRQDLHDVVKRANNLLYVTHDYYQLTASKVNLLENTLNLVKSRSYKTAAWVAPFEHDNEQESVAQFQHIHNDALKSIPQLVGVRSDYTFGPTSTFTNSLSQRIKENKNIHLIHTEASAKPVFTGDLDRLVASILKGEHAGQQILLQGTKSIDFKSIIHVLEGALGQIAQINQSALEKLISPSSQNLISQAIYTNEYQNLVKQLHYWQKSNVANCEGYKVLHLDNMVDIEAYYKENKPQPEQSEDLVSYIVG